jgi:hypothetical protein
MTRPRGRRPGRVTIRVRRWAASLGDPGVQAFGILAALLVGGFVMFGIAWHGGARTPYVPLQLPWLVSGSLFGLALIGMALGGWSIHLARRQDAVHRDSVETVVRDVVELAEDVRSGRVTLSRRH